MLETVRVMKGPKARNLVTRTETRLRQRGNVYEAMHQQLHASVHGVDQRSSEKGVSYRGRSVLSWTSKDE